MISPGLLSHGSEPHLNISLILWGNHWSSLRHSFQSSKGQGEEERKIPLTFSSSSFSHPQTIISEDIIMFTPSGLSMVHEKQQFGQSQLTPYYTLLTISQEAILPSDRLGLSEAASQQGITKQSLFTLPSMQSSSHSSSWGFSFICASLLETVASSQWDRSHFSWVLFYSF